MRSKSVVTQVEAEAALYALGALPPSEAEKFGNRLAAGCSLCGDLAAECAEVVSLLPLAAPEVEPPPSLRGRLLESIGAPSRPAPSTMGEGILLRADETGWKPAPAPGVEYRPLHGSKTMLVRMAPKTWL